MPSDPAPQLLAKMAMLDLACRAGDFDLAFRPSGTGGCDDLSKRAVTILVGDNTETRVADFADVIRSKRAAGRPKDLKVLPSLDRHGRRTGAPERRWQHDVSTTPARRTGAHRILARRGLSQRMSKP